MNVEKIVTLRAFEDVRRHYEQLYDADSYRNVFVSWAWLASYFRSMRRPWIVLAANDGGRYVAFCVLVRHGIALGPLRLYGELALGAYPTADYGGVVIAAGEEKRAAAAFADAIRGMRWDVFRACNISDPRVAEIVKRVGREDAVVEEPRNGCYYVALPESWEAYAARSRNGHPSVRYVVRRKNAWRDATYTEADDATFDRDLELLLRFHQGRWNSNLSKARRTYGRLFREAYDRGCCRVGVMRDAKGVPLAAQAAFVDRGRRSWGVYMLAYDRTRAQRSPGIGMLASGLQRAIGERFREYDFLRGDEAYKAQFGCDVRWLSNTIVRRQTGRSRVAESAWNAGLRVKAVLRRILFGRVH
jgi:CelD/BcsL family acetyltransferase involved in cellulose biosynthesis